MPADSYTKDEVPFSWRGSEPAVRIDVTDISLPQFRLTGYRRNERDMNLPTGKLKF